MAIKIDRSKAGLTVAPRVRSVRRFLTIVPVVGMIFCATLQANQLATDESLAGDALPAPSPAEEQKADEVVAKLQERNHLREVRLQQYSVVRTYLVSNDKGKVHAKTVATMHYQAPGTKSFETASEEGSKIVRRLVFKGLMQSEVETAAGRSRHDSSIRPENYTFRFLGEEDLGGYHCFVVQAFPKRKDKYLFEGKVWIDSQDFAVVKIVGRPAKNPSFWINRVDFVRRYQKIGEFWFPLKDESYSHLRIHGKKILTIDHRDYRVNEVESADDQTKITSGNGQTATPRSQTLEQPIRGASDWRAETRSRSGSTGNR